MKIINDKIFFSIVIPLYNKEKYISRTIKSILNQSYKEFEIIIINDGSTDNSIEEVKKFNDDRIKLISKKNGGESSARNRGIRKASYDYIAFLDADDEWVKNHLEIINNLINQYPNAIGYATALRVKERDGTFNDVKYFKIENNSWEGIINNYFEHLYNDSYPFSSSTICLKKDIFEKVGFFDEKLKIGPDIDMWTRYFLNGEMVFTSKIGATYYRDAENRSVDLKNFTDKEIDFINHYSKYIAEIKCKNQIESFKNYTSKKRLQITHRMITNGEKENAWKYIKPYFKNFNLKEKISILYKVFI